MRKIHRVIYTEIAPPALIALVVLTFVVFSNEFGRLTETLIRKNADPVTVFEVVASLLPSIMIFTVPISFLVGTLMGFSRLSAESEIVAMRASGVGVFQILRPVMKVALGVMVATAVLTFFLLPAGNWNLRLLRHEIGVRPVQSQLKPRVFNEDLPGKLLYVEDISLASGLWKGVFLSDSTDGEKRIVVAREGEVIFSPDNRRLQLYFSNGSSYEFTESDPQKYGLSQFGTLNVTVELPESDPGKQQPKRAKDKDWGELVADLRQAAPDQRLESLVELNRRAALPLSPFIFGVLGVTLGITSHRGGRGYGSIVSMVIAFGYYVLFATGSELSSQGVLNLVAGVWGANLLMGAAALLALHWARRGVTPIGALANSRLLSGLFNRVRSAWNHLGRLRGRVFALLRRRLWGLSGIRFRAARVVDLFMMRGFGVNLVPTLIVCVTLFYVFTFFELIDDVFSNNIRYGVLFEYFFYLLPQVLMLLVPISILIATLITFGVLEKTFQIVAFKSCGISLYRLAAPVVTMAILISAGVYVFQDYILPFANQRQDSLRNLIKGRPVQTSYHPGRNWIFGEGNRLYNYNYFDPERNLFAELSIYDLDITHNSLMRHTYAQRAVWDRSSQVWRLSNGWTRPLSGEGGTVEEFSTQFVKLAEKPDYFLQEVKESSKMTYLELESYIRELQRGGFEVDHLRTELYKKISFPLVSLVMVVLGIPFAFSVGRKGALYGIAAGVVLGIAYWGAFGVFGVLGGNGLLSPALAAWGPNLLFGSGGLFLLLSVRT